MTALGNDGGGVGDIAIIGMAAHLPGAATLDAYWANLAGGIASIRRLDPEQLAKAGVAAHLAARPDYVPFAAPLDGFEMFDAEFFGLSPKEAAIMDPQHRQFLETAWEALEIAGHMPERFDGPIGVFAGCGMGSYFTFNLLSNPDLVDSTGLFLLRHTGNDKDFLATRLSHMLDLRGPSIGVQTACSTSLVATHMAAQALLNGECDMALAGGSTIELPQGQGYLYREGEILSPDGQCHAFDHRAQGTVFGSGAGVVVLRRLEDALADGDHVWAVLKGSAVNNDGAGKAGYLAPSVDGQAAAIAEAQDLAGVGADSIDYVECHGTGTYLGDPIEVAALSTAFRRSTAAEGFCKIGSVKTNIGHLDTAAGAASLIKTALALHHRQIPPSLGYEAPNPAIGFDGSPFVVADRLADWPRRDHPRRAGVNSLGVGGTNAHAILQEAPDRLASEASDWPFELLCLSGRSKSALDANAAALAAHLRAHPEQPLADVAHTLAEGRRAFDKRRVLVAHSHAEAAELLERGDPRRVFSHAVVGDDAEIVFMFPGGGAQYAGMARDLYETEPVFRDWMDRGLAELQPRLDYDIRALWLPDPGDEAGAEAQLRRPSVQLPLIMITEYALAQLWISWGVAPARLIGHSMGENTAAALAGVMSFEDCIGLVHLRGQLFDTVPEGGMLSVALSAEDLRAELGADLDLAAINAPQLSVASGPVVALDALAARLAARGVDCQRVAIDIAAHGRMLDGILDRFAAHLATIPLSPPTIPVISNRSGAPLTDAEATDPAYWVGHLRNTVDFARGLAALTDRPRIFLEVGPGRALGSLAGQQPGITPNQVAGSLRHPDDPVADDVWFMAMLGRVWAMGGPIDRDQIRGGARRNRVVLPTYAFQRSRYFIAPGQPKAATEDADWPLRDADPATWVWRETWPRRYADTAFEPGGDLAALPKQTWLIFTDTLGLGAALAARLREAGHGVVTVAAGDTFARLADDAWQLAPERGAEGHDRLIADLAAAGRLPDRVVHLWLVTGDTSSRPGSSFFHRVQEQGFWSLFHLARAWGAEAGDRQLHLLSVTSGAQPAGGARVEHPSKATLMGPALVIPREFPGITSAVLDIALPKRGIDGLVAPLLEEALARPGNGVAALRGATRHARVHARAALPDVPAPQRPDASVVLITGGFGGIGLTVAEALIRSRGARIALLSRSALPPRADWPALLSRLDPDDPVRRRIDAVARLEAAGGTVEVIAADVSNPEEMQAAVARIGATLGPIRGVIHAAGAIADAPMLGKQPDQIEEVLAPKLYGTRVLDALFPDGALDWMVLFSSSSTVTAPAGQVDYLAANEYLNAYAASRAGGRTRVTALGWGLWSGVGMAAEAMAARSPAPVAALPDVAAKLPMLDYRDAAGGRFAARWIASDRWFLDQHRTASGDALLPGTGYLELAAEALAGQGGPDRFELRDLRFLGPLRVPDSGAALVRLTLTGDAADQEMRVMLDDAPDPVATARLAPIEARSPRLDLAGIEARIGAPETDGVRADGSLAAPQEQQLRFGPQWRVLRSMRTAGAEGLARLQLAEDADPAMPLHPGLVDLATGWAMRLIPGYAPTTLWVPVSYASVRVFGALPRDIASWVRLADSGDDHASFDISLAAPDGTVLVEIAGFAMQRLAEPLRFAAPARAPAPRPLSPAEERLRHNLTQGIRPDEGGQAFLAALDAGLPQLVISSLDLDLLTRQAAAPDRAAPAEAGFDRPDLDGDYVAPETATEQRLAGFWKDLLGLDKVGAEDSFFDLGGHSLIAVRMFAMIKKGFGVDFPISLLFEAPTIRAIATRIEAAGAGAGDADTLAAPAVTATDQRRFIHLVPMHDGRGGTRAPLFLVAGMFGNVLNLRHLAQLVGRDRPVWGLQARGLLGDQAPHRSTIEAARDCLAEMRQVQRGDRWILGGFSGGGITAFEIAQQLAADGDEVAALLLLDTPLPQRAPLSRRDRMAIQLHEARARGLAYPAVWAARRLRWEIAKRRKSADAEAATPQFHDAAIEAAFLESVANYRMRDWSGPLTLFRPPLSGNWQVGPDRWVSAERAYVLPDNGWRRWAPRSEVIEVPGDHDSMVLEPNVRVLAGRLRRAIEAAERPQGSGDTAWRPAAE